jgi:AcrR family transcriptional regulator
MEKRSKRTRPEKTKNLTEKTKNLTEKAKDLSTEEKIKEAARHLFTKKGYSATRTRDIAEEAGINLALLNYYFRSKEKLFNIVILENFVQFIGGAKTLLNEKETTLEEKIEGIADLYIGRMIANPDLPLFIINEIHSDPKTLKAKGFTKDMLWNSYFMKQFIEEYARHKRTAPNPIHHIMNIFSMTIFPFIASPILKEVGGIGEEEFLVLMEERRKWIPVWIKKLLLDK